MSQGKASRPSPAAPPPASKPAAEPSLPSQHAPLAPGYYEYYGVRPPAPTAGGIQRRASPFHQGWGLPPGYREIYGLPPNKPADGSPPGPVSRKPEAHVQRRGELDDRGVAADASAALAEASATSGAPLPQELQRKFGSSLGADLSGVRVHTGEASATAARSVSAQAYTIGQDIHFGAGKYDPGSTAGQHLLAHEVAHTAQQASAPGHAQHKLEVSGPEDASERAADAAADAMIRGEPVPGTLTVPTAGVQRKEVEQTSEVRGDQDWTRQEREQNAQRWQKACYHNLMVPDASQYVKIVERRDFYKWFYEFTAAQGYTTRWALAASLVANGAHQIADLDGAESWLDDLGGGTNVELQGMMREGNQVIFDNVLPKLRALVVGGPLTGRAALQWDMKILAEEQNLIQPLYDRMSPETRGKLDYLARKKGLGGTYAWASGKDKVPEGRYNKGGRVPGFDGSNLQNVEDRWAYGMELGKEFAPEDTGWDPARDRMPPVGQGYRDGTELRKVDTRANLHQLDAWLAPGRLSRVGSGNDVKAIIARLTPFEKAQVLTDRSPDGWAYSARFAQFSFLSEETIRQALPDNPAIAAAAQAFLARYREERRQVELRYPNPSFVPIP